MPAPLGPTSQRARFAGAADAATAGVRIGHYIRCLWDQRRFRSVLPIPASKKPQPTTGAVPRSRARNGTTGHRVGGLASVASCGLAATVVPVASLSWPLVWAGPEPRPGPWLTRAKGRTFGPVWMGGCQRRSGHVRGPGPDHRYPVPRGPGTVGELASWELAGRSVRGRLRRTGHRPAQGGPGSPARRETGPGQLS